ncbi:MAG: D-glycero-beta-D-manno-heptose 1-phosphate adenylyltransferase [Betaproteobacteria bacterium]|nr:D-glycero-beta-D-manno-heptose 1-phosphate adenylyltransferase [Betaproteobacteria bacterium]
MRRNHRDRGGRRRDRQRGPAHHRHLCRGRRHRAQDRQPRERALPRPGPRQRNELQPRRAAHRRNPFRADQVRCGEDHPLGGERAQRGERAHDRRAQLLHFPLRRRAAHRQGQGPLRGCQQVQSAARQGGQRERRGLSPGPGETQGGGRRGGNRPHHRRRAEGGEGVRVPGLTRSAPAFESKLCEPSQLAARLTQISRPLVFTNGCFDILHRGHVTYLAQARALGANLMVGVNTDASVKRLGKGDGRPVNSLADRMAVLAALESVSLVTWFDEDTPLGLILACRPEVLVKGGDWKVEDIVGSREVTGWGGRVHSIPFVHERSTTATLEKIRRL